MLKPGNRTTLTWYWEFAAQHAEQLAVLNGPPSARHHRPSPAMCPTPRASERRRHAACRCWSRRWLPDIQPRCGTYAVRFRAAAMQAELPTVSYVRNVRPMPLADVSMCGKM